MPKQIIETGTVLFKKCLVPPEFREPDAIYDCFAIVSFVVTEPGFMAEKEDYTGYDNDELKCRVRAGTVLSVEKQNTGAPLEYARSIDDPSFYYRVGETVRPRKPFAESDVACAPGIHGFLTREQAEAY